MVCLFVLVIFFLSIWLEICGATSLTQTGLYSNPLSRQCLARSRRPTGVSNVNYCRRSLGTPEKLERIWQSWLLLAIIRTINDCSIIRFRSELGCELILDYIVTFWAMIPNEKTLSIKLFIKNKTLYWYIELWTFV